MNRNATPFRLGAALRRWSRHTRRARAASQRTDSGAVVATYGPLALKLQSPEMPRRARVAQARHECRAMRRMQRERRAVIGVIWFDARSATLHSTRTQRHCEPALLMHRLDEDDLTRVLTCRPERAVALAQDFGALLARFHRRCARVSWAGAETEHDGLEALVHDWQRFGPALGLSAPEWQRVQEVAGRARAWLAHEPALMHERCRLGWRVKRHPELTPWRH